MSLCLLHICVMLVLLFMRRTFMLYILMGYLGRLVASCLVLVWGVGSWPFG